MSKALVMRSVSLAPDIPPLRAVRLESGQVGATLQSLCAILGLNVSGQQKRIVRARNLRSASVIVKVATKGGPQEMIVLLAWAVPLWVIGIQIDRLDATKRARVLIIQTQAVQALYQAFSEKAPIVEEIAEPDVVSAGESEDDLATLKATVRMLVREVAALTRQAKANERLLAATIQRVYWMQDSLAQQASQQAQPPQPRRRGRPRRAREPRV